tara:strand:+ start:5577 stop:5747 length:171 start_codon:yes stop_codon:yes gene_type:complete
MRFALGTASILWTPSMAHCGTFAITDPLLSCLASVEGLNRPFVSRDRYGPMEAPLH